MVIFDLPTIQYHIAWIQIIISSIDIFLFSKTQIKVMKIQIFLHSAWFSDVSKC